MKAIRRGFLKTAVLMLGLAGIAAFFQNFSPAPQMRAELMSTPSQYYSQQI